MTRIFAKATHGEIEDLHNSFVSISVDERFSHREVNIDIPDEIVDEVLQWFEDHEIEANLV